MKVGVFLARMQPLHKAHIFLIEEALKDNDKVLVVLGSSNKKDMIRNPYSLELRKRLLTESLPYSLSERIQVIELPDWTQESDMDERHLWGEYLYYNIVSEIKQKTFTMYYSDDPSTIKGWFSHHEVISKNISFKFYERKKCFDGLSATLIRDAILNGDIEYISKYCPEPIVKNLDLLRDVWKDVLQNPDSDFSMS